MIKHKDLKFNVFRTRGEMGAAAGRNIEKKVNELLSVKEEIRMIFAAAPSQNEVLDFLAASENIDWGRVTAFHMDEYIGLKDGARELFSAFLNEKLFARVKMKKVNLINSNTDLNEEIKRYSALITEAPVDIVCLGIGENGHIAFNDPLVADFNDPHIMKVVRLDHQCRMQQVNDGCFPSLNDVPEEALTLTIPALFNASHLFCVVPGERKRIAVYNTIYGPIDISCPASILQRHPDCRFYFDTGSFGE
ncbi:MAG: glucosamine-6-phosphate deaminase [Bacteroidota bacterium]